MIVSGAEGRRRGRVPRAIACLGGRSTHVNRSIYGIHVMISRYICQLLASMGHLLLARSRRGQYYHHFHHSNSHPSYNLSFLFNYHLMASPPSIPQQGPRFRPYASPNHQVSKGRYITSNDPRGYMYVLCLILYSTCSSFASPVYEYPLNGQWIMMDIDDGYILWTGIWKGESLLSFPHLYSSTISALGNSKGEEYPIHHSQSSCLTCIQKPTL
jgi:hypothetical protein